VSVDNESIAKLRERWPLRRSVYAELIARLSAANAKLIELDY
jgi:CHASE2 domain-containing sensor protein